MCPSAAIYVSPVYAGGPNSPATRVTIAGCIHYIRSGTIRKALRVGEPEPVSEQITISPPPQKNKAPGDLHIG